MKDFISFITVFEKFSFIELFKERDEVVKKEKGWKMKYQTSDLSERNAIDKDRVPPLPASTPLIVCQVSFALFIHSTINGHWAFVLKMPQGNRSYKQPDHASPLGKHHSSHHTALLELGEKRTGLKGNS